MISQETVQKVATKSFQKLMEKRLNKSEIAEIEQQAALEARALKSIESTLSEWKSKNDDEEFCNL